MVINPRSVKFCSKIDFNRKSHNGKFGGKTANINKVIVGQSCPFRVKLLLSKVSITTTYIHYKLHISGTILYYTKNNYTTKCFISETPSFCRPSKISCLKLERSIPSFLESDHVFNSPEHIVRPMMNWDVLLVVCFLGQIKKFPYVSEFCI